MWLITARKVIHNKKKNTDLFVLPFQLHCVWQQSETLELLGVPHETHALSNLPHFNLPLTITIWYCKGKKCFNENEILSQFSWSEFCDTLYIDRVWARGFKLEVYSFLDFITILFQSLNFSKFLKFNFMPRWNVW